MWKPSPKAAAVGGRGPEASSTACCERHGLPGIFQLFISAGTELAEKFVDDRRVDLVSFTGSTAVGRKVGERVAARLGKSLLELGGNNAIIVDEYANLDLAVPSIVFGAVGTAGQRCTTTRRVFVHESRSKELEQRLTEAYAQVHDRQSAGTRHADGPADRSARGRALQQGARKPRAAPAAPCCAATRCVPARQLRRADDRPRARRLGDRADRNLRADPLPDRVRDARRGDRDAERRRITACRRRSSPTACRHAERFLSAAGSDCGIANVNIGTSGAEIGGAFGGEKDTGGGRESGSDSWKAYMRRQTNTINWSRELPLAQGIDFKVAP